MEGKPLVIDLFCGLGGWAEGFLSEGYDVVGFDIERRPYPGQLVLQDVLTLHGSQFRDAAVIVASPPCQAYSYRAMPWGALWLEHSRMDDDGGPPGNYRGKDPILNDLFLACFRLQREASDAAGLHVPMVVENVKGAQAFVGRSQWSYGSFHLWGDIPALMPTTGAIKNGGGSWFAIANNTTSGHGQNPDGRKVPGINWSTYGKPGHKPQGFNVTAARRQREGIKAGIGATYQRDHRQHLTNPAEQHGHSSRSDSRKAASAEIAKIPFPLAQHIARVFKPSAQTP